MSFQHSFEDDYPYANQNDYVRGHLVTSPPTLAAYGVLLLISLYYFLQYLEHTYLPLSQLLWNTFVYMVPAGMVSFLDPEFRPTVGERSVEPRTGFDSIYHANKSNALRRAFGLDGAGVMTNVQRSRRVSELGSVFKSKAPENPPGLGNWDHSCYQNSVIQGLASLQSLPGYLAPRENEVDGPTTKALRSITETLNAEGNAGKTFWTPAELKSMSSWQQQDAQEYFSKVMDALEKDSSKFKGTNPSSGLQYLSKHMGTAKAASRDLEDAVETSSQKEDSRAAIRLDRLPDELRSLPRRNPLDGLLAQRVGCQKCGFVEGLSLVPFNCLTVPLGRKQIYDVRDCLDEYTALESINGVDCTNCTLLNSQQRTSQLLDRTLEAHQRTPTGQVENSDVSDLLSSIKKRLDLISQALDDADYSDGILKKCQIPPKSHVTTTKSRQAVVARPPQALVIHINRSIFDELTGEQSKNQAAVKFPLRLNLGEWCLGNQTQDSQMADPEQWSTDPMKSMIPDELTEEISVKGPVYELRAAVTHYGRHENGHYICYRRSPYHPKKSDLSEKSADGPSVWWRLSDEDVTKVSEETVLSQGGVFMLFYEQIGQEERKPPENKSEVPALVPIPEIDEQERSRSTTAEQKPHGGSADIAGQSPRPVPHNIDANLDHATEKTDAPKHDRKQIKIIIEPDSADVRRTPSGSHSKSSHAVDELDPHKAAPAVSASSIQVNHRANDRRVPELGESGRTSAKDTMTASSLPQPMQPRTGRDHTQQSGTAMEPMAGFVQAN